MDRKKILLVDDDMDLLRGLSIRLRASGYDVAFATDGLFAITQAVEQKPDVIILDIGLPCGDGFHVLQRLRSLLPVSHIPIIILTARDPSTTQERALKGGAEAFFQKPPDNDKLLAAIQSALGGPVRDTAGKT